MPDSGLILDGVKDFIDGEAERSEFALWASRLGVDLARGLRTLVSCR